MLHGEPYVSKTHVLMLRSCRFFILRWLSLPLFCLFFRVYPCVELPCVYTLTILLGVMEGLIYQRHVSRQCDCNIKRFYFPYLHIDLGSFDLGTAGIAGSICFRVCINLGHTSVCHPLFSHRDTTLTRSTKLPLCKVVHLSQRHTGGSIYCDSEWFFRLYIFVNLVFVCV